MLEWFAANGANLVIVAIVLLVVVLAGRNVYKTKKSGGCSGCPHSSSCGSNHCDSGYKAP